MREPAYAIFLRGNLLPPLLQPMTPWSAYPRPRAADWRIPLAKAIHSMIRVVEENLSVSFYRKRIRTRCCGPAGFRHVHAGLSAQRGSRLRARTDDQQGQGRALRAWRRIWPHGSLRRRSRRRAQALRRQPVSIREKSSSSTAKARCLRGSFSWPTPTAIRSRCCNGTDATNRRCAPCRSEERQRMNGLADDQAIGEVRPFVSPTERQAINQCRRCRASQGPAHSPLPSRQRVRSYYRHSHGRRWSCEDGSVDILENRQPFEATRAAAAARLLFPVIRMRPSRTCGR